MFPIKDDNPTQRPAVITVALIVLNALVFAVEHLVPSAYQEPVIRYFAVVPARFAEGAWVHGAVTLVTSQFLHGGLLHIAGNLLYLWIFGNNVEDWLGRSRFIVFYIGCGVVAALSQVAADPGSTIPMVGASGAIAGVLGAYLVLYPKAQVHTLVILLLFIRIVPLPAALWLGIWFLLQVVAGFATLGQEGGVAWWAHAGGFAAGAVAILLLGPRWRRRLSEGGFRDGEWSGDTLRRAV